MSIGLKIMCDTTNLYNDVLKILKENECQFFSHDKNADKVFKVVIFGLEYKTAIEVKTELISRYLKCQDVKSVVKNHEGFNDTIYIVSFDNGSVNLNTLKKDHSCPFRTIIKWDYHRKPKNRIVQCRNCQMFGHGENWCSILTKCDLCAGKHKTDVCDCKRQIKCATCNGSHVSADLNCPNRQQFLEIRENIMSKNSAKPQYRNNNQTSLRSQRTPNWNMCRGINNITSLQQRHQHYQQQQQPFVPSNRNVTNNTSSSSIRMMSLTVRNFEVTITYSLRVRYLNSLSK